MPEQHTVAKTIVLNESNQVLVLTRAENRHRPLEPDLPGGGVDPEFEIGVAVEQGAYAIVHLHRLEAREEA